MAGTTQYKNSWQKANLDRINLTVPKGQKKLIQDHASAQGESINRFINRAIREAMEREQTFEQSRDEIIATAQKYDVHIDEHELKKLAVAFAALKPIIPDIQKTYFFKLDLQTNSSDVVVISRDRSIK